MTEGQKDSLKKADSELTAATEKLETEELEQSEWVQLAQRKQRVQLKGGRLRREFQVQGAHFRGYA